MGKLPIFLAILAISFSPSVICKNRYSSSNHSLKTAPTETSRNANNLTVEFDLRSSNINNTQTPAVLNETNRKILLKAAENPWNISLYNREVNLQQLLNYNVTEIKETNDTKVIEKFWPLYNRSSVVAINDLNYSQVDEYKVCDGLSYIARSFDPNNEKIDSAVDLATKLASSTKKTDRFLIIMGHRGSGKTVTLVKMLHTMRRIANNSWTLAVDLSKLNPSTWNSNRSIIQIFRQNLDKKSHKLFSQVLKNNPSKVNILLDNYDRIVDEKLRNKLFDYCLEYNDKGVGIILTTSHSLDKDFTQFDSPKLVEIPEMTKKQMEIYLTQNWQVIPSAHGHYQQIRIYAKAVAELLNDIKIIPQIFSTVKHLSQLLYYGDDSIFHSNSFMSVESYITQTTATNPPKLMKNLLNMRLNKMALFDKLMGASNNSSLEEMVSITGEMALKSILAAELTPFKNNNNYPSMDSEYLHYPKPQFINTEISRYLTSKLFLTPNITNTVMAELSLLLRNKKYANVVEYINGNLKNNNNTIELIRNIMNKYVPKHDYNKLIDILIENGFDDVLSNILEGRNKRALMRFFLDYVDFNVESQSKYKFGLLVMDENSRTPINCSRLDMVLKMKMEQTQSAIFRIIYKLQPDALSNTEKFLKNIVLTDSKPNFMIYQSIVNRLSSVNQGVLNDLMLTTFRHAGRDSKQILTDLIDRGANVQASNSDGKTLIHLAVQQSDPELLQFIVDKLNFSISDVSAESVLVEALDANPFNWFSRPQFWQMMHYLLDNQNFTVPSESYSQVVYPNVLSSSGNEMSKMLYDLLTTATKNRADELISDLIFVDLSSVLLTPDITSARRRFVLHDAYYNNYGTLKADSITLTELLLAYRGLDNLDPLEEKHFFATLAIAIGRDVKLPMTTVQQHRIADKLCDTIVTKNDLQTLLYWLESNNPTDMMEKQFMGDLVDNLLVCLTHPVPSPPQNLGIQRNVLFTRSEIFARSMSHEDSDQHVLLLRLQSYSVKNPYYGSECIDKTAKENPKHCHISKDDLDTYVSTETKDGNTTNVINTNVFNELIDENNNNDTNSIRIDQLIGATAMLVFEKGYQLTGDYESATLDILELGSIDISSYGLHTSRLPKTNDNRFVDYFPTNPNNNQNPYSLFDPKRPDFSGAPWDNGGSRYPNYIPQDFYSTTPAPYIVPPPIYRPAIPPSYPDVNPLPLDQDILTRQKVPVGTNPDLLPNNKILPDLVPERPLPFRPFPGRNG